MIPLRTTFGKPAITGSLSSVFTSPTGVIQPQVASHFENTDDGIVAMADEWGGASDTVRSQMPPWNGDPLHWYDLMGNFKANCHDVTPIAAQRMRLLESYLSPRVRSNIAQHLRDPKYTEALRALQQLFGNHRLIDHANVAELIPAMKD